jgi:hypothetical protein
MGSLALAQDSDDWFKTSTERTNALATMDDLETVIAARSDTIFGFTDVHRFGYGYDPVTATWFFEVAVTAGSSTYISGTINNGTTGATSYPITTVSLPMAVAFHGSPSCGPPQLHSTLPREQHDTASADGELHSDRRGLSSGVHSWSKDVPQRRRPGFYHGCSLRARQ